MSKKLRIVFMGTPEFAVASLEALLAAGFEIAAVVTAPDKPAGRGKKLMQPAVKIAALSHGLTVLQPERLKAQDFVETIRELQADLGVVVAFRMLPEVIWAMPKLGTFNLHASLLPDYRGAAPINHAIINGETETGITTFFLQHDIDTGDIIFQKKMAIGATENAGELHDRLMYAGADLVVKTAQAIRSGDYTRQRQQWPANMNRMPRQAPKIFKEDTLIDWEKPVKKIYNKIRGLSPYPTAYTVLRNPEGSLFPVKIYRAAYENMAATTPPGSIVTDSKTYLKIYGEDGLIDIQELQMAGKTRMSTRNFLNGFDINERWQVTG
ncbi:MAG: methionyl-tRNA formyltransferase [Bacteroidales bacterium]|jgi:methionyl-tRNA formyltransferase|nr:methionyl-tRNA formyltransferase [Bacteroidales bacterium]NCU34833.1 methionyl-tRNA formyltransferase [Candidatus Falkowbacteria bacterium]MDD2633526.1 methionyl-tRNA formyltransferase [Bacteroidales bacterium]MDD3131414.1 methionyl-tRNA formyltransferase [Bacteroidales bacterium]MDD3526482.1 methionyl-tRNA formyltransferase [Bacteroidales bacterium]